jgi:hypothetical protein
VGNTENLSYPCNSRCHHHSEHRQPSILPGIVRPYEVSV